MSLQVLRYGVAIQPNFFGFLKMLLAVIIRRNVAVLTSKFSRSRNSIVVSSTCIFKYCVGKILLRILKKLYRFWFSFIILSTQLLMKFLASRKKEEPSKKLNDDLAVDFSITLLCSRRKIFHLLPPFCWLIQLLACHWYSSPLLGNFWSASFAYHQLQALQTAQLISTSSRYFLSPLFPLFASIIILASRWLWSWKFGRTYCFSFEVHYYF